jgi:hypothetical protein
LVILLNTPAALARSEHHRRAGLERPSAVCPDRAELMRVSELYSALTRTHSAQCHLLLWGRRPAKCHLVLVGQTLRLRAAPSRALQILQTCREAGRGARRRPRACPTGKCPNLGKLSDIGRAVCALRQENRAGKCATAPGERKRAGLNFKRRKTSRSRRSFSRSGFQIQSPIA